MKPSNDAYGVLSRVFGYQDFRDSQKRIIDAVNEGRDGMAIMATGGGKSLCYQIPALMSEGTSVVVSPLISLMKDQVDTLRSKGVAARHLYGNQPLEEKQQASQELVSNRLNMLYISPERLQDPDFIEALSQVNIARFIIDEAHCVSIWGHDFRKSYTRIGEMIDHLGTLKGERIQRFGYTATANEQTREDIASLLYMTPDHFEHVGSFDRPNLTFSVRDTNNKMDAITEYVLQNPNETTIIYSATIKMAQRLNTLLRNRGIESGLYHGQMEHETKDQIQNDFMNDRIKVMVATNAFGMGVDKSNVRHVLHLHMPANLESYYQEAGRGGRDGLPSEAVVFYNERDRGLQEYFIDGNYPSRQIVEGVRAVLGTFPVDEPFNVDKEVISHMSTLTIKPFQVDASLRIMEDQGLIDIGDQIDRNTASVVIKDLDKPLDLDFMAQRRQIANNLLHLMTRYCVTNSCRKKFILKNFGERTDHSNCGGCDVCKNDLAQNYESAQTLPAESIKSVLMLNAQVHGRIREQAMTDLLLGVEKRSYARKSWDKVTGFGALENWYKDDVKKLIEACVEQKMLNVTRDGNVEITNKGRDWLAGLDDNIQIDAQREGLGHRAVGASASAQIQKTGDQMPVNRSLRHFLHQWRHSQAHQNGRSEQMIMDDATIDRLSRNQKINDIDQLVEAGLSPRKAQLIGDQLLKDAAIHEREQYRNRQGMSL